jgi:hypothetical protein
MPLEFGVTCLYVNSENLTADTVRRIISNAGHSAHRPFNSCGKPQNRQVVVGPRPLPCCCRWRSVLGEKPGRIVNYFALEDSERRLKSRMQTILAAKEEVGEGFDGGYNILVHKIADEYDCAILVIHHLRK